jgi:hypothetical protein
MSMLDLRSVLVAAALGAALLAPTPATAAPACAAAQPYGAAASADLLRLGMLDLRPLGLSLGPVADVRIASTGAGMATDAEVAAAAAARDAAADLLGSARASLGQTVRQQAPPTEGAPATGTGAQLDLGVLRARIGEVSARATWDERMRCGMATGPAGKATASLLSASVLEAADGRALVALPGNLASGARTALVEVDGVPASRATATASLTDLRLFAGSRSETTVKVLSEPTLAVTATGQAASSSVRYDAPVLEVSGPGIGTHRLDSAGTYLDLALPAAGPGVGLPVIGGGDPLGDLPRAIGGLAGTSSGPERTGRPLELAGLLGLPGTGRLPVLGDVLHDVSAAAGGLRILRLSLGHLEQRVDRASVSATAASLRLQLLAWDGERLTEQSGAAAVLDLGIGLLEAAATAPANPAEPPAPGGGCGDCGAGGGGGGLPVTGSAMALLAGAGALLTAAGGLLLALSGRIRRTKTR